MGYRALLLVRLPRGCPVTNPVEEARRRYDDIQREIGFDPSDPRYGPDGTFRLADELFAALELAVAHRARQPLEQALWELRAFVENDSLAITYQSFGQYRTVLLKRIDAALKSLEAP